MQIWLKNHKLIINASPVGTFPKINLSPELPYGEINETHILFDLIYNKETLFLNEGKRRGAIISNGLKCLNTKQKILGDLEQIETVLFFFCNF